MSSRLSPERLAVVAATVTVVLWASAFVAIRQAGAEYSAGALALGRMLVASAVLGLYCLVRREKLPPRAAWPAIAVAGVLWYAVYMVALNWGEQQVDAGTAALVVNVGPILMALLGGWLLKEGFPPRLFAGMAVAFAGAAVVGLSMSGDGHAPLLGVLACLLSAATWATSVVVQKPALRYASPLQVTTWGATIGAVALLPFTPSLVSGVREASFTATANVVYLGVFPTAVAFTTWSYALARTSAGKMGATTYASPAIVVLLSWLFLREVPGWVTLLGGVLCLAGVAVTRSRPRRAAEVPAGTGPEVGDGVTQRSDIASSSRPMGSTRNRP
ncbi:DMT family transporter [Actinomadura flavalba]|uniref:DMT family transporter n=1 Tax=Actinomadura flavalba TaxID=1120938 RepID=UPI00037CEF60|nr:DMT family transporter [Actinomadura flavalba]